MHTPTNSSARCISEAKFVSRLGWAQLHLILFVGLTVGCLCIPPLRGWPAAMLVPLVLYAAFVRVIPPLHRSFRRWHFGVITKSALVSTMIIVIISCAVLVVFHVVTHPDVQFLRGSLPVSNVGGVITAGIIFAVLNATLEEFIFRGIMFDAIESCCGVWVSSMLNAIVFGYFHMHGYPPGLLGAVLAGIYGSSLCWLRLFTGGLGWPIIAHVAADATIFTVLACEGAL